jgi:hypothetical protein
VEGLGLGIDGKRRDPVIMEAAAAHEDPAGWRELDVLSDDVLDPDRVLQALDVGGGGGS